MWKEDKWKGKYKTYMVVNYCVEPSFLSDGCPYDSCVTLVIFYNIVTHVIVILDNA